MRAGVDVHARALVGAAVEVSMPVRGGLIWLPAKFHLTSP
jgi:hypothetical protein